MESPTGLRGARAPAVLSALVLAGCVLVPVSGVRDVRREIAGRVPAFDRVLRNPGAFRVQLLISSVERGADGRSRLRRAGFRAGAEYFYPASAIKLTVAVAALEALQALDIPPETPMEIAPLFPGDPMQQGDSSNLASREMTVAHEVRKLALVSDNQAFNRLIDLVGLDALNRRMHTLGLRSVRVNHRLSDPRVLPDPRASAAVTFRVAGRRAVTVPARTSVRRDRNHGPGLLIGHGLLTGGTVVPGPVDFSLRNGISLMDLQDLLAKLVRPDIERDGPTLHLAEDARRDLIDAMTRYPRESPNPVYAAADYPDDYVKFLLPGIGRVFPFVTAGQRIDVTGKSGQAYGFTVENAYLRNPANGRAVFVAATIYTNADGVLNDDQYEYATVALPFMADLGELVARRWLTD